MRAAGAMPGGHGAIATAFQTVLVVLLAWAALLWSGLAGTVVGFMSPSLAAKLATSAPFMQRHVAGQGAVRILRRDAAPAVAATTIAAWKAIEADPTAAGPHEDSGATGVDCIWPRGEGGHREVWIAVAEPKARSRCGTPPSRAPPTQA